SPAGEWTVAHRPPRPVECWSPSQRLAGQEGAAKPGTRAIRPAQWPGPRAVLRRAATGPLPPAAAASSLARSGFRQALALDLKVDPLLFHSRPYLIERLPSIRHERQELSWSRHCGPQAHSGERTDRARAYKDQTSPGQ